MQALVGQVSGGETILISSGHPTSRRFLSFFEDAEKYEVPFKYGSKGWQNLVQICYISCALFTNRNMLSVFAKVINDRKLSDSHLLLLNAEYYRSHSCQRQLLNILKLTLACEA